MTIFENFPDAKPTFSRRLPFCNGFPQWRFFAPNPGVDNVHIFTRSRPAPTSDWEKWAEMKISEKRQWWNSFWNPLSRPSQALFDIVQQIKILAGYGASYEWATTSSAYLLLVSFISHNLTRCKKNKVTEFQFMLLTSSPASNTKLDPIFSSPPISIIPSKAI